MPDLTATHSYTYDQEFCRPVHRMPKTWARPGNDAWYTQVHARESVAFNLSQWRKFRTHAQPLKAALNTKHVSKKS